MLGVVILNFNTFQYTVQCVESVRLSDDIPDSLRIYIVDGCSTDGSYERLKDYASKLRDERIVIIQADKNGGFSYGNNYGLRLAVKDGCDNILCTNSDVVFNSGAIKIMMNDLLQYKDCAVVGPKVYCDDGTIQNCNVGELTVFKFIMRKKPLCFFDFFGINKKYNYSDYDYSDYLYPTMVSGCCFMIRSDVLEKMHFLDEDVFLYYEENILGAKIKTFGMKVMLDPKAEIIHYGGKSTGGNSPFLRYHNYISALYFLYHYKHISKFTLHWLAFFMKVNFFIAGLFKKGYWDYIGQIGSRVTHIAKKRKESHNVCNEERNEVVLHKETDE